MKQITTLYIQEQKKRAETVRLPDEKERDRERDLINLYPQARYQRIEGFGGAFTDAAGYVFSLMPKELQRQFLDGYFSKEGLGYTCGRTSIDSCDFSRECYASDDTPGDTALEHFDIFRPGKYVLPLLKGAQETAGKPIRMMFTPWTPPAWMKTNGSRLGGGRLKKEYYGVWAEYICRYLLAFRAEGAQAVYLSPQNEPKAAQTWDSCLFSPEEEQEFIRDHLSPALQKNGLKDVGVLIWDHNKERAFDRAWDILKDPKTAGLVAGVAMHWYSGDHFEALQLIRDAFPDKKLIFSEACVEYSLYAGENQLRNAQMYAHDLIGNLNHGLNLFLDWNLLLDQQGGPNHVGNFCDAPVMYDTETGKLRFNLSYDYIGHFSRYIQPGAERIGLSRFTDRIEAMAALNPDGALAVVALNRTKEKIAFCFRLNGKVWPVELEGESIATFLFDPNEWKE